jgi:hypothetical protein
VHRSILAVDIEGSTQRTNPVKEELIGQVYRLVTDALAVSGIDDHFHDPFIDRGDGILVLIRPADELPKPLLLSRMLPALAQLLAAYNNGISPADPARVLRLRAVLHRSGNAPFGEDLDVAFRLLDAPRFKAYLRSVPAPLALVASDEIYWSIIRHGYDGIDDEEFTPLVSVMVAERRRRGWVHLPRQAGYPVMVPAQARSLAG